MTYFILWWILLIFENHVAVASMVREDILETPLILVVSVNRWHSGAFRKECNKLFVAIIFHFLSFCSDNNIFLENNSETIYS